MQLTRVLVEIISLPYCFASSNSHIIISPAFLAFLYKKKEYPEISDTILTQRQVTEKIFSLELDT